MCFSEGPANNSFTVCVFSDGPANDCCTVCVLQTAWSTGQCFQTVQLMLYCVCFADGPANVVLCVFYRRPGILGGHGEQGVCELRGHVHTLVATGWHGPLPVQRLRPVQQDERHEQTSHQAAAENGQCCQWLFSLCPLNKAAISVCNRFLLLFVFVFFVVVVAVVVVGVGGGGFLFVLFWRI